ncbi:MAG: suppressor of fused domain protein [Armatimonadota bacterium]
MEDKEIPLLIAHIERSLGKMDDYRKDTDDKNPFILVTAYKNQPCEDCTTLVTLGLSNHLLNRDGRDYRMELILAFQNSVLYYDAVSLLMSFGQYVITKHKALLRGDVIGPATPIMPDIKMTALYASCPTIFDDDLAVFEESDPPTIFVWLLPIYTKEAEFIYENGWSIFEDILIEKDPNLLDFHRESIV